MAWFKRKRTQSQHQDYYPEDEAFDAYEEELVNRSQWEEDTYDQEEGYLRDDLYSDPHYTVYDEEIEQDFSEDEDIMTQNEIKLSPREAYQEYLNYGSHQERREEPQIPEKDRVLRRVRPMRARYSASIDRFLNNGILLVAVLLILVLVIAFLI